MSKNSSNKKTFKFDDFETDLKIDKNTNITKTALYIGMGLIGYLAISGLVWNCSLLIKLIF